MIIDSFFFFYSSIYSLFFFSLFLLWKKKKKKGSSIAQYTGQALYKKLLESKHFAKKEYKEAFRDAFMSVDKALLEGKKERQEKEKKREREKVTDKRIH